MGIWRAERRRGSAPGSGKVDSGSFGWGRPRNIYPLAGNYVLLGLDFWRGNGWPGENCTLAGFFVDTNPNSSFVFCLRSPTRVHLTGGMIALLWGGASASLLHKPVESRRIVGGHHGLVLAFYGGAVDLRIRVVGICAIAVDLLTPKPQAQRACVLRRDKRAQLSMARMCRN